MFARQPCTSSPDFSQSLDSQPVLTVAHKTLCCRACEPSALSHPFYAHMALPSVPNTPEFLLAPKSQSRLLPCVQDTLCGLSCGQRFLISRSQLHSPETPALASSHRGTPPTHTVLQLLSFTALVETPTGITCFLDHQEFAYKNVSSLTLGTLFPAALSVYY